MGSVHMIGSTRYTPPQLNVPLLLTDVLLSKMSVEDKLKIVRAIIEMIDLLQKLEPESSRLMREVSEAFDKLNKEFR